MLRSHITDMLWAIFFLLLLKDEATALRCDRRPYGITTQASESDGRYRLEVMGIDDNAYIPEQLYTVQISETDGDSRFIQFMITVEGDIKVDPINPRKMIYLSPGDLRPQNQDTAKFSDKCPYSVEQAFSSTKSSVQVYWLAPSSGNGCVTIRAMVAENDVTWFEDGTPLTKRLCEDLSQPDDISPRLNNECQICNEAKYELEFTGIWSRNTHPRLYPENDWVPRYSDLVGASHSSDLILWIPGSLASDGLKNLAEYANSSSFEAEIKEKIGDGIRTLIKGKGHGYNKMNRPTYAFFRANKLHHLITTAIALYPSPDWFLGVTRFELCQADNTWLPDRELNLYPWDAGTDSGVSYESPNFVTYPQDAITRVEMSTYDKNSPFYEIDMKNLHPFGKLRIKLIKTYDRECEEEDTQQTTEAPVDITSTTTEEVTEADTEKIPTEPEAPSRYQNPEIDSGDYGRSVIPTEKSEPTEDCPLTDWTEWSPCEGICDNGKIIGIKWRERYHLVDGIAVEKYDPNVKPSSRKEVSEYCKNHYDDFERADCMEDCPWNDKKIKAQRRKMYKPVMPGHKWVSKKRDVRKGNS